MSKPTIMLGDTPVAAIVSEYKRLLDLAPDPVDWVVSVTGGDPMTDEQMETHITLTPETDLTPEQREHVSAMLKEFCSRRGIVVYKGIPILPIEIVEKPS